MCERWDSRVKEAKDTSVCVGCACVGWLDPAVSSSYSTHLTAASCTPTTSSPPVIRSCLVTALDKPPLTTEVLPASAKHASRTGPVACSISVAVRASESMM